MKIPYPNFKSLYTNIDSSDVSQEYLSKALNVRLRQGYAVSEGMKFETMQKPQGEILWLEAVELDEDRLKTKVVDGEIVQDYKQNITHTYLLIVKPIEQKVRIYLYLNNQWEEIVPAMGRLDELTINRVVNEKGVVKIYAKEETLWLGKISRHWKYPLANTQIHNGYYLDRLIEPYPYSSKRRLGINLTIERLTGLNDPIEFLKGDFEEMKRERTMLYLPTVGAFVQVERIFYKFITDEGETILNPNGNTQDWIFTRIMEGLHAGGILIPKNLFVDGNNVPTYLKPYNNTIAELIAAGHVSQVTLGATFYLFNFFVFETLEWEYIAGRKVSQIGFDNDKINFEILVTATEDYQDEYVVYHEKRRIISPNKYGIKIKYSPIENLNKRTTNYSFYIRFDDKEDFEQIKIVDFWKDSVDGEFNVSTLSPNGTFLVQTIGTLFDPKTFEIISLPDDASTIDGIGYVIKDRNIYHSAIGGGKVLENTFYPGNIIPTIEGDILLNINSYPAVADIAKPKITLLSVVEDEGIFLFATKDQWSYEIKDAYDIAEMPEGVVLNTKQGIILTNGESSEFLSEEINNICESRFDESSIYLDQSNGELFYVLPDRIYRYWTLGGNWTEFPTEKPYKLLFSPDGTKLALYGESLLKWTYGAQRAILKTHSTPFNAVNVLKKLNFVTFDFEGKLKFNGKEVFSQDRTTVNIYTKLKERRPMQKFSFEIEFEGTLYGLELDLEAITETRIKSIENNIQTQQISQ